jgi:hypothetical protein
MSSAQAQALVIARNESLPSPDGSRVYQISVPDLFGDGSPVGLRLRTLSYGGGTTWESPVTPGGDPVRNGVSSGGFDPIITLFNSSGNIVSQVDDSSILGNQPDPNTGVVYDSASDLRVAPGTYQLRVTQYDNFDGSGLNGIDGFTDATGAGRTNQFTVQAHTISDYLSNSVRIEVNGGAIRATLEPKTTNLFNDLFDLAAFGGFNHFNWLNEVVDMNLLARLNPFGPGVGDFDPLPGGNTPVGGVFDEYDWYFDEAPVNSRYFWSNYYRNNNTQALFGDSPNQPSPGASITFTTYLAGVRGGNNGAIFANIDGNSFKNLAFSWRYTQGFSGGSVSLNSFFANPDPSLGGGGNIEFLGFLQPEDWTQERIARLQSQGLTIAGLEGGSLTTPTTTPTTSVPEPSLFTGLVVVGVGLLCKKKNKQEVGAHTNYQ